MTARMSKTGKAVLITGTYADAMGTPLNIFSGPNSVRTRGDTFDHNEFREIVKEGWMNPKTGLIQLNW